MEGNFRTVLNKLELKGFLGDKLDQGGLSQGGHITPHISSQSAPTTQQQQSPPAPPLPLQRGEGGRGPGGLFRPQLGGPPPPPAALLSSSSDMDSADPLAMSSRETADALSKHTGPVLMRDKGITFFNPKRNVKSCEKPTPNIGDYLVLDDKNCLHPADNVKPVAAARGEAPSTTTASTTASRHMKSRRGTTKTIPPSTLSSPTCHCAASRQHLEAEQQRCCAEENDEYAILLAQLEDKVSQRVAVEAQLKVLRFMKKAENKSN